MKCVIVDDNPIARTTMVQLTTHIKDILVVDVCSTAVEAYNFLQKNEVNIILLDIEMPEMSGLELAKNLGEKRPLIIFTTSKKEYAVEAFELNVVDYIVKPVTVSRFIAAIDKARFLLESNNEQISINDDEFIFIRDSNIVRKLTINEILYAEAMGDYVKLYTAKKFYAIHTTLKAVEEKLSSTLFLRVHRSYIISISKIETIQDGDIIINGKPIPVADAYRAKLNKRLDIL